MGCRSLAGNMEQNGAEVGILQKKLATKRLKDHRLYLLGVKALGCFDGVSRTLEGVVTCVQPVVALNQNGLPDAVLVFCYTVLFPFGDLTSVVRMGVATR